MEQCDQCGRHLTAEMLRLHWPVGVIVGDSVEYICPDCYGDDAYCLDGHMLDGRTDTSACDRCDRR